MLRSRPAIWFAFLLLAGSGLAGCNDGTSEDPQKPERPERSEKFRRPIFDEFGMDLEIPAESPPPAPSPEDYDEVLKMWNFSRAFWDERAAQCGESPSDLAPTPTGDYYRAILAVKRCSDAAIAEGRAMAESFDNDEERMAAFWEDFARANQTIAEAWAALKAAPISNTLDAQIAALLGELLVRDLLPRVLDGATGSPGDFGNLMWELSELESVRDFARTYPWTPGECNVDYEGHRQRVNDLLNHSIERAEALAHPDERNDFFWGHGKLLLNLQPHVKEYEYREWWPGLLYIESQLELWAAYWDNFVTDKLPTWEEAVYLKALYENHTNNMATGILIDGLIDTRPTDEEIWEGALAGDALMAKVLPAMQWHFDEIECTAAE